MKKILFALILCAGLANASTVNHVWIPFPSGSLETQCRHLWNEYDLQHGTKTTYIVKPGMDGLIATNDMLASTAPRRFMCGGSTQVVSNALIHVDNAIDRIDPLLQTAVNTMVWYVPNQNKSRNLKELVTYFKSQNRPINIGVFFAAQRGIVNYLERVYGVDVNLIPYRSGPQMYPDLANGSLDLAFDSGAAVNLAKDSGKFQILGYLANNNYKKLEGYPNFRNSEADLPLYYQWLGIFVPQGMPVDVRMTVTQQLQNIVKTESFRNLATENLSTVTGIGQPELGALVVRQRRQLEKHWK